MTSLEQELGGRADDEYAALSQEEFDRRLVELLKKEPAPSLLAIAGVYEILSEYFNNDILDQWRRDQDEHDASR